MKERKVFSLNMVSQSLITFLVFVLPIFFYSSKIFSIENLKLGILFGVVLVVLLFWSISWLKNSSFSFPQNILFLSIFLVLLSALMSSVFSDNPFTSIFGNNLSFFSFFGFFILFSFSLLIGTLFKTQKSSSILFITVYSSLVLSLIISLLYIFIKLPNFGFFFSHSVNTIGNWTDLGVVSSLVLVLSLFIIETYKGKDFWKILAWFGLAVSIFLTLIISENIIWISLGTVSVIYLIYKIVYSRTNKNLSHLAIIIVLFSFLMLLAGNTLSNFTDSWLKISFSEIKPSFIATYQVTEGAIKNNPIIGVGINRFERAWQLFKPDSVNASNYWGTDFRLGNSYLASIPAQTGILGVLVWLLFITLLVVNSIKLMFKKTNDEFQEKFNLMSSISILFLLVVLSIHVPSVTVLVLFFIFLGLFISALERNNLYDVVEISIEKNPKIGFLYIFLIIFLMIVTIYIGYISSRQFVASILLEKASSEASFGDFDNSQKDIINSINIFKTDQNLRAMSRYYQISMNKLLLENQNTNNQTAVDSFRDLLNNAINSSMSAISFDKNNYLNYLSLGNVYEQVIPLNIDGAYDQAVANYEEARKINFKNPGIYIDMARVAFVAGKNDVAKNYIDKAIEMKPNFVDAGFLLSQIQAKEGDIDGAINNLQALKNIGLNNSDKLEIEKILEDLRKFKAGASASSLEE